HVHSSFGVTLPPRPTLFPYTTLFRSAPTVPYVSLGTLRGVLNVASTPRFARNQRIRVSASSSNERSFATWSKMPAATMISSACRSEEHTSELQSRENLVCRLLLEKKK